MRYSSKLLGREIIAGEIMLLRFQKPEGFNFLAGQFCFMTTPDLGFHDQEGLRKPFSIASSPLENELIFVVRLTESAFKKTLKEMADRKPGRPRQPFRAVYPAQEHGHPACVSCRGPRGIPVSVDDAVRG